MIFLDASVASSVRFMFLSYSLRNNRKSMAPLLSNRDIVIGWIFLKDNTHIRFRLSDKFCLLHRESALAVLLVLEGN